MKRIFSLLVACFMLVGVFSALAVTGVSAAEPTTYTLPMNWARGIKQDANGWDIAETSDGIWRLTSFEDLSDVSTMRWAASTADISGKVNTTSPKSYIETYSNRDILSGASGWTDRWYVNYGTRWQNKAFDYGDNATYIKVLPGNVNSGSNGGVDENNNPTVVFIAPKAGNYSYTEFVKLVLADANVEVTVRKNGTPLATKTAVAAGETISGTVELAQGDLLMFAFELKSTTAVADSTPVLNISNVEVKEATGSGSGSGSGSGEGSGTGTGTGTGSGTGTGTQQPVPSSPWSLPMDWSTGADVDANGWELSSYYNGLWRLTSFEDLSDITTIRNAASTVQATEGLDPDANNTKTPQSYIETLSNRQKLVAGVTSFDRWYVNFGTRWQNKAFDYGDNSTYIKVLPGCVNGGGNGGIDENNNPTVVFTAPKAGTYSYTEFVKLVVTDATVEVTVRKNGTVLKTSTAVAAGETISGEVELAQGDLLMFAFTLKSTTTVTDSTPVLNISDVVVAEVAGSGTGGNQGGQGGSTVSPDTGAFSIAALVGTAVAAVVTGKVAITKRRRNG